MDMTDYQIGLNSNLSTYVYIVMKVSCIVPTMEPTIYGQYFTFVATEE